MENIVMENMETQVLDNPGTQGYTPCGCSEMRFRFHVGQFGNTFEVRYWLATDPNHNHRHDKPRVRVIS